MARDSPSAGRAGTKAVTPGGAKMDDDATRRHPQTACAVDKHPIVLLLWDDADYLCTIKTFPCEEDVCLVLVLVFAT